MVASLLVAYAREPPCIPLARGAEVPLIGLVVNPARTEGVVLTLNGWIRAHGRRIAVGLHHS
jgi:hypothetical protein